MFNFIFYQKIKLEYSIHVNRSIYINRPLIHFRLDFFLNFFEIISKFFLAIWINFCRDVVSYYLERMYIFYC